MKRFQDIVPGDKLYILEPMSDNIRESTVTESFQHPKSMTKKVWVLKFYKLSNITSLTEEKMAEARKYDSDVILTAFVEGKESVVIAKIPSKHGMAITAFGAEREPLERWVKKSGKDIAEMLRTLKG